ncbi:DUF4389 domain-containing protein [Thalassovita taeanensis]|uniref:DUF4389 domain-containing protein n=1 Tax=Thalassovita taeanensis TaxID=657014 RepID=A0A1H9KKW9_9RHOB|nr:DUF4389 domain-containing protein [Thalassovita taeanensis]SEQ99801.1 protein of unknown function [Thalassovita taeanensis]
MTEDTEALTDPVTPEEPVRQPDPEKNAIWMRLLYMVILAVLFGVAETVLLVAAILQFGWLLFTKKRNAQIAEFGSKLGSWMQAVARFQTASTEDKPFPWARW